MLPQPDERPRAEKLAECLALTSVIVGTERETVFREYQWAHGGRNPRVGTGKALGICAGFDENLDDYDPHPPLPAEDPRTFLEMIADRLRAELSPGEPCTSRRRCKLCVLAVNPDAVVADFAQRLAAGQGRSPAAPAYLRCALEALGLPAKTAHDWVKRATPDPRPKHLAAFVHDRCCLAVNSTKSPKDLEQARRFYKVGTGALFADYTKWCQEDPTRLDGAKPFKRGEFVREVARCGGVGRPSKLNIAGKPVRGFYGIALRK